MEDFDNINCGDHTTDRSFEIRLFFLNLLESNRSQSEMKPSWVVIQGPFVRAIVASLNGPRLSCKRGGNGNSEGEGWGEEGQSCFCMSEALSPASHKHTVCHPFAKPITVELTPLRNQRAVAGLVNQQSQVLLQELPTITVLQMQLL